ncbi:MAG TPA: HPr family phosphocarrier protein [Euzebyales bacterium]|nr:HPr family phosphocarrier protein [Euzebyales bacterium]
MPSQTVTLRNGSGLHARPARVFAKAAKAFDCDVRVRKDGDPVNAKSALSVLTLDCHQGDQIEIITEGDGADKALDELVALVDGGLGEDA